MDTPETTGRATYSPEDNKLRLYVGRVPRAEYEQLRAEGWQALHKQREAGGGDFAAVWTPSRYQTALKYSGGIVEDEDMGPAERAADRAERFSGYREKRIDEATGHADKYDAGPSAHGFQSEARAEKAAARHDRIGDRACDAWDKAEYWQRRTAGVISHALHLSSPSVRMGRIKTIEADMRKAVSEHLEAVKWLERWSKEGLTHEQAVKFANYDHVHLPRKEGDRPDFPHNPTAYDALTNSHSSLYAPRTLAEVVEAVKAAHTRAEAHWQKWIAHYTLRLAYENQMIEAQGGRAASLEIEVGGTFCGKVIAKVNKSNATGRVVSVHVLDARVDGWVSRASNVPGTAYALRQLDTERAAPDAYKAPTDESRAKLAEFETAKKAHAKATKATKTPCPIINPTDADAERLQALWNEEARAKCSEWVRKDFRPSTVRRITQATYSEASKGTYARAYTSKLCPGGKQEPTNYNYNGSLGDPVCQIRATYGDGNTTNKADSVVILTDKPQKPLPAAVWVPKAAPVEEVVNA